MEWPTEFSKDEEQMHSTEWGLFTGEMWEAMMQVILKVKYAPDDYQPIVTLPSGDHGLEGFTRTGLAFQCYCPNQDYASADLYEKQRDKITTDLNKLELNAAKLQRKLGNVRIVKWILVTPKFGSNQLLDHAIKKRDEIRLKKLPIIDPLFDVLIYDGQYFSSEITRHQNSEARVMRFDPTIEAFEFIPDVNSDDLTKAIREKSSKIESQESRIEGRVNLFRRDLITGDALLRNIYEIDPLNFRGVKRCLNQLEKELPSIIFDWNDSAINLIAKLKETLDQRLKEEVSSMSVNDRSSICSHAISRWIAQCPLNFEEK